MIKNNKVLLGKRKNSHGDGTWSFPGGHLEFGEEVEECAIRETKEETNLDLDDVRQLMFTNDIFKKENKHYVTLYMTSNNISGELKTMEPDKCEEWNWFEFNDLPKPLFLPIENLFKNKNFKLFD